MKLLNKLYLYIYPDDFVYIDELIDLLSHEEEGSIPFKFRVSNI